MTVRNDCLTFQIMGKEIHIYSEKIGHGRSTVADIDGYFHYLGDEPANIAAAVFAWQEVNGRDFTGEELRQVLVDNHLISEHLRFTGE
jgi:hypothetical protein